MDKLDIAKKAATVIVGAGTGKIVAAIIENNIETDKMYQKIQIVAAGVVIGMMAKDATKAYTDAKIDHYVASYRAHVAKTKETIESQE